MSRIRADQLVNRAGSGGPKFPHGVAEGFSVSGVVTATSYRGDGSQLTGIDASSLKDGSNVKVQAQPSGATVTGILTVTNNIDANDISGVNATFSGNATVQGNLTVNGTTTTIDTAVTEVDSLNVEGNVGIGTTNATEILHVQTGTSDEITTFKVKTAGRVELSRNHADAPYIKTLMTSGNPNIILGDSVGDRVLINGHGSSYFNGGNIGIGTVTPDKKLVVKGSGGNYVSEFHNTQNAVNNNGVYIRTENTSAATQPLNVQGSLIVTGAGNIGINSTSPSGKLDIGGNVFPAADNTHDLGSSSKRWANIYTGDLNLSNEGSANDVDGTWGQYTIQEGEDDLFLINRRTGKKYKFNLTEVD